MLVCLHRCCIDVGTNERRRRSSTLSSSLTLVKLMLLLKIVSLSFMHTPSAWTAIVRQQTPTVVRQLSDSCPTVRQWIPTVSESVRQPSDSQDGARAPSQSDSPTVVRQSSDSCPTVGPTVTSDSVRQCPTVRQFVRQFRQFRQPGLSCVPVERLMDGPRV